MRISNDPHDIGYRPGLLAALTVYVDGRKVDKPITVDTFQQLVVEEATYPNGQPMLQLVDGCRQPVRVTKTGRVTLVRPNGQPWPPFTAYEVRA